MTCEEIQARFSVYLDLAEDDGEREEMEAHLLECEQCAEQFRLWEESESMIHLLSDSAENSETFGPLDHVNRAVMERIYAEDSWLKPVVEKSYHFSKSFRRNLAIVIAGCMAVFACALIFFVTENKASTPPEQMAQLTGLMDTANVSGSSLVITADYEVPVAGVTDPFVLQVVPSYPQYWAALSLLGIVITLLILNWLSRTRN
ncbi:anti-sigma factor family protein [Paenibacillus sp. NPDC058071]|uniref:anti-sigma factor n=1 Tax=Paenibacillus sp. NPDC058071 TaxID=3346326 RepID=UPI0036DD00EC